MPKIISLKVGKIKELTNKDSITPSAINKIAISNSYLTTLGFEDDEQADKKHHGGENKAILFFSIETYKKLEKELNISLSYEEKAPLGENILVSDLIEENTCVGDIFELGESIVQVTQPREPCNKLNINTKNKDMLKTILTHGYTGWYAKVLEEGVVKVNDEVELVERIYPNLTISKLNKAKINPKENLEFIKEAVSSEVLGKPFKEALEKHLR